jgi:LL-diaminopimelate aminotransferase
MNTISQRMQELPAHFFASLSSHITQLKTEGKPVIRLDEGSPDLPPASFIVKALNQSANLPDRHGYQSHKGPEALRYAWAEMYLRVYGVQLDPSTQVLPLIGSKEGIFHAMLAWINPGDIVLIPDPAYITYSRGVLFAGGIPHYLPLLPSNHYLPELSSVPGGVLKQARILWLNYPNNPTAATADRLFFEKVIDLARHYGFIVCHDAAYSQVTYDGYYSPSILEVPGAIDHAVEFNSLSKSHNMAGWRVAVAAGNAQLLSSLYTLKTNLDSSHFLPILEAATQAMTGDQSWLSIRNQVYQKRRDIILQSLKKMGLETQTPKASLFVWSAIPASYSSEEFCVRLLNDTYVSLTPGTVFGKLGDGYVRISITAPEDQLIEAMSRMERWLS